MLLAQARFLSCDFEAALRCCTTCTKAEPAFANAALLHAQILLRQEKHKLAHSVLEQALSHNFAVRESPVYHLVKSKVLQSQGELTEVRPPWRHDGRPERFLLRASQNGESLGPTCSASPALALNRRPRS